MNAATNKSPATKTFNYKGPNLWGVKFVRYEGKACTLLDVSCCWKTSTRTCSIELANGETIHVSAEHLEVIG